MNNKLTKKQILLGVGISTVMVGLLTTAITFGVVWTVKKSNYKKDIRFLYSLQETKSQNVFLKYFVVYERNTNIQRSLTLINEYATQEILNKISDYKDVNFYFCLNDINTEQLLNFDEFCKLYGFSTQ